MPDWLFHLMISSSSDPERTQTVLGLLLALQQSEVRTLSGIPSSMALSLGRKIKIDSGDSTYDKAFKAGGTITEIMFASRSTRGSISCLNPLLQGIAF